PLAVSRGGSFTPWEGLTGGAQSPWGQRRPDSGLCDALSVRGDGKSAMRFWQKISEALSVRSLGMGWGADNGEAIMALEALSQSGQWDQYWRWRLRRAG